MDEKRADKIIEEIKDLLIGLEKGNEGIEILLRQGKGIREEKIEKLCELLDILKEIYTGEKNISKQFVELFLDFQVSCENSFGFYQEEEQDEILEHIEEVLESVREILSV